MRREGDRQVRGGTSLAASGFLPGCALEHPSKCSPRPPPASKIPCPPRSPQPAGGENSGPWLPSGIQPASILRHTYSCQEHCLRIWFGTLSLAASAGDLRPGPRMPRWLADICAVCLSRHAPGVRGWQEALCPRSLLHIFTKVLHKGLLMMKTMMASAEVEDKAGPHRPSPPHAAHLASLSGTKCP